MGCNSPLGLVVAAARGRQHPAARVAPPQTLMGCSPVVAVAQPVLYNILTISAVTVLTKCELYGFKFTRKLILFVDNLLVLLIGGIPIAMPTVLSVTMAIGSHKLAQQV
jgi:hypothetical protein